MRFNVLKTALKSAIEVSMLAVSTDATAVTSSILFKVKDSTILMWSTDRRVLVRVPLDPVEDSLQGSGSFTIEAARLMQWISNVKADTIEFDVNGNEVTLKCGTSKGHFASLNPDNFPDFQARLNSKNLLFNTEPESFISALKFVRGYIGDSTTNNAGANNYQVTELIGNHLYATDSFVLSRFTMGEADMSLYRDTAKENRFKVSKDEIRKLIAFLSKTCDQKCTVSKSDLFIVESDDGSLFAYPNTSYTLDSLTKLSLDALAPAETWTTSREDLTNAVGALIATADPDDISLVLCAEGGEEGTLTLKMQDASNKHVSTVAIPLTRSGAVSETLEIHVNHKFFTKPLSTHVSNTVVMGVSAREEDNAKYILFQEEIATGDSQMCLVTLKMS